LIFSWRLSILFLKLILNDWSWDLGDGVSYDQILLCGKLMSKTDEIIFVIVDSIVYISCSRLQYSVWFWSSATHPQKDSCLNKRFSK
jgi:hypothetical protein